MNYQKIYNQIIEKRKLEEPEGYTEVHHIIPASLGGTDDKENLLRLTAREHFICHYLLAKLYPKESIEWYKMNHAFMMMKCNSLTQNRYFNSRLYDALRGNLSSIMSITQSGKGNSQYGTMWICNVELKENRKIKKNDIIPDGWIKGRNKWNKSKNSKFNIVVVNNKVTKELTDEYKNEKENLAKHYYNLYIQSDCKSLNEFVKKGYYSNSLPSLTTLFCRYLPGYIRTQGISK